MRVNSTSKIEEQVRVSSGQSEIPTVHETTATPVSPPPPDPWASAGRDNVAPAARPSLTDSSQTATWAEVEARATRRTLADIVRQGAGGPDALLLHDRALMARLTDALVGDDSIPADYDAEAAAGDPTNDRVDAVDRPRERRLTDAVVHALSHGIDWNACLGRSTTDARAVFLHAPTATLRNAMGLSLKEAADAIDTLIARALRNCPNRQLLARWPRQLRLSLTGDPTLALEPLPDTIRYGGREWAVLRAGMDTAAGYGFSPSDLAPDEFRALAQAAMAEAAPPGQAADPGTAAVHTTGFPVMYYMAAAAGALDAIAAGDSDAIADAVHAYARREFDHEIRLAEALATAAKTTMPTRKSVAAELLRSHDINPDYRVKTNFSLVPDTVDATALVPAGALSPVSLQVKVPVLPVATERTLADDYFERDTLPSAVARQLFEPPPDAGQTPGTIAQMRMARAIDAWLSELARETGVDLADAPIGAERAEVLIRLSGPPVAGRVQQVTSDEPTMRRKTLPGCFVTVTVGSTPHIAYFPDADAAPERLPAGTTIEDWTRTREEPALRQAAAEMLRPGKRDLLTVSVSLRTLAHGKRSGLPGGSLASTLESAYIRSRLPASLSAEFDKRFDRYRDAMTRPVADAIDAWLSVFARRQGVDLADARLTIGRAEIDVHRPRGQPSVKLGLQPYGPAVFGKRKLPGYFISVHTGSGHSTWYLPFGTGNAIKLPADVTVQEWIRTHKEQIFDPAALRTLRESVPGTIDHTVTVHEVGRGKRSEAMQWLPAGIKADIDRDREEARDMNTREKVGDALLNLIPFRAAYVAFQKGDIAGGLADLLMDGIAFIPAMYQCARLAHTLGRASIGAFRQAARSLGAGATATRALQDAASGAATLLPQIGRLAGGAVWAGLDGANPIPFMGMPGSARAPGGDGPARALRVAATLEQQRPALAARLRTAVGEARPASAPAPRRAPTGAESSSVTVADASLNLPEGLGPAQLSAYAVTQPADTVRLAGVEEPVFIASHGSQRYINMAAGSETRAFLVEGNAEQGWRIVAPGKPAAAIAVEFRDGAWRVNPDTGLAGGAPTPVLRQTGYPQYEALLDVPAPEPYSRSFTVDAQGDVSQQMLRISETATVQGVKSILNKANDLTLYDTALARMERCLPVQYDVAAHRDAAASGAVVLERQRKVRRDTVDFYRKLYRESPTFRGLYNNAYHTRGVTTARTWKIVIEPPVQMLPDGTASYTPGVVFAWDHAKRTMRLPPLHAPLVHGVQYLTYYGELLNLEPTRAHIHVMVEALTGHHAPNISDWYTYTNPAGSQGAMGSTLAFNPEVAAWRGLGERGPVEYLTQRILEEAGIRFKRRLTAVAFPAPQDLDRLNARAPDALHTLARYVDMQDRYLEAVFPRDVGTAPPVARATPDEPHIPPSDTWPSSRLDTTRHVVPATTVWVPNVDTPSPASVEILSD